MRVFTKGICLAALTLCIGQIIAQAQVLTSWVQRDYFTVPPTIFEYGAADLKVDSAGNAYVSGTTQGTNGTTDALILKYDPAGNLLWRTLFDAGMNADESGGNLALDPSGSVYITCGESIPNFTNRFFIVKCDAVDGRIVWSQQTPASANVSPAMRLDGFGNPYLNYGMTVLKYDSAGNKLWQWTLTDFESWYNSGYMQVDPAGYVYITGNNFFTAKLDPNGNGLWTNHYGGPLIPAHGQFSTDITFDQTGATYVTGHSEVQDAFTNFDDFATTVKYDTNGNQVWVSLYDGTTPANNLGIAFDTGAKIAVDNNGQVYVAGYIDGLDTVTLKIDSAGQTLWASRRAGGNPVSLAFDTNGNVYLAATGDGIVAMKFDPDGNRLWLAPYSASTNSVDNCVAMALGASNTLYLVGDSFGKQLGTNLLDPTNTFISTIKYIETNAPGRPQIITQPVSQTVDETLPASFTVQATGALSYQWFRNGTSLSGETNATLQFSNTSRDDSGGYSVSVSNDSGTVLSPEVRLDVQPFIPTVNIHITYPKTKVSRRGDTRITIQRTGRNVDYELTVRFVLSGTSNAAAFDYPGGNVGDLGTGGQPNAFFVTMSSGQSSCYFTLHTASEGSAHQKNRTLKFTLQPDPLYKIGHNKSVTAVATY